MNPDSGRPEPDTVERILRDEELCDRFENAWRSGAGPVVEDFLRDAGMDPDTADPALVRELVRLEAEHRGRAGDPPASGEGERRFPQLKEGPGEGPTLETGINGVGTISAPAGPPRFGGLPATLQTVPEYELVKEIGRGAMGVVFEARHRRLNRTAAVKMLLGGQFAGTAARTRFLAEAEVVAAVKHPHVVQVYEFGEAGGIPYLALEYCPNGTLSEKLKTSPGGTRPPDLRATIALIEKVARGVAAAHELGIVHRDLKPANVLLDTAGEPKVTDFGLAKRGGGAEVTQTGVVMGTPAYMSPEQADGRAKYVGPQADVWALGVILYEALTNTRPFTAPSTAAMLDRVKNANPESVRKIVPGIPRDLELICRKCLEKEPRHRYPTAAELADDLRRFANGQSISVRPAGAVESVWRWCRRNPLLSGSAAAIFLTVVAAAVAVTVAWRQAVADRNRAVAAGERANLHTRAARATVQRWVMGANDEIHRNPEVLDLHIRLLREAIEQYGGLARATPGDADIRAELGQHHVRLGHALEVRAALDAPTADALAAILGAPAGVADLHGRKREELLRAAGAYRAGEEHLAAAVAGAAEPADARVYALGLANCRAKLSLVRARQARQVGAPADDPAVRAALVALGEALEAVERHPAADVGEFPYRFFLVDARTAFGGLLLPENPAAAAEQFGLALRVLDEFPDDQGRPAQHANRRTRVRARFGLAQALRDAGDRDGELRAYRAAAGEAQAGYAQQPDPRYRALAAESLMNLGMVLNEVGRTHDARDPLTMAEAHLQALSEGKFDLLDGKLDKSKLRADLANCRSELGQVLGDLGRWQEARKVLDDVVKSYEELLEQRGSADDWFGLAFAHHRRGQLFRKSDDHAGAEGEFNTAAALAADGPLPGLQPFIHLALGELRSGMGDTEAKCDYRAARRIWEARVSADAQDYEARYCLAWMLGNCPVDAVRDPGRAVELATKLTRDRELDGKYWQLLGIAQFRAGNWGEAITALGQSDARSPEGRPHGLNRLFLAMAYEKVGKKEDARKALREARKWVNEERHDPEVLRFLDEATKMIDPAPAKGSVEK